MYINSVFFTLILNLLVATMNVCHTRWKAKCDAVKAVRYQTAEVVAALEELEGVALEYKDKMSKSF